MNLRIATTFLVIAAAAVAGVHARPHVHPGVHRALRQDGVVDIMVVMKGSNRRALESIDAASPASRGDRIERLVETLEAHADASSTGIEKLLTQESGSVQPLFTRYEKFWIVNQVFIEAASFELIERLAQLPSIEEIREEEVSELDDSSRSSSGSSGGEVGVEWGVEQTGARDVWAEGFTGQGVVVGSIDSGVRGTHESLASNFVGDHGWYAPPNNLTEPSDKSGHGTHTMGTIAGSGGIGVAPGVKWMACRGCPSGLCVENYLLTCFQFMLCPTDTNGLNRDCAKAPHVVNNSWSSPGGKKTFAAAIDAWRAAGIIPVFASGNTGPECGTARSPGDLATVISVGSTAVNGSIAISSSKGPAVESLLVKPDFAAPGVLVRSAVHDGDSAYALKSGTSMATPHVVGVIALLLSAKPSLSFDEIRELLVASAERESLTRPTAGCGNESSSTVPSWPNNDYGNGRVNVHRALERLLQR